MKSFLSVFSFLFLFQSAVSQEIVKNSKVISTDYKRSSLYTLMITDPSRNYENDIKEFFVSKVTPDKYNNHNLQTRTINRAGAGKEIDNITEYLKTNKIANQLVAKWFNRSAKGGFDMALIKERGFYDASVLDITQSKNSARGLAKLADAGEELINNTFVLVNDSKYTNKEEVAEKAKSYLSLLSTVTGTSYGSEALSTGLTTFGKGFVVATNAHLFKLVWNEEVQNRFYMELYADDKTITPAKKAAFDEATFFELQYVGTDKSYADVQSTSLTTKTNSELVGRATIKSIDNVITKLQNNYDVFKTKTPIFTSEPLTAKIGVKDGITNKTKFEILEQEQDENGKTKFVKVGTAKVDTKYPIWDNTFGAEDEKKDLETDRTHFKSTAGKDFYPGMLLRQIK